MVKVLSKNENSGIRVFRFLKKLKKIPFASIEKVACLVILKVPKRICMLIFNLLRLVLHLHRLHLHFGVRTIRIYVVEEVESG